MPGYIKDQAATIPSGEPFDPACQRRQDLQVLALEVPRSILQSMAGEEKCLPEDGEVVHGNGTQHHPTPNDTEDVRNRWMTNPEDGI